MNKILTPPPPPDSCGRMLNPSDYPHLKPSEVVACLEDVPINNTLAAAYIGWIQGFIQFQSTLAYLKDPPSGYDRPPVDLFGGLDQIAKHAISGYYKTQYDLEFDTAHLISSAFDGHLTFYSVLLNLFAFFRKDALVSISLDGEQIPKVYILCKPS